MVFRDVKKIHIYEYPRIKSITGWKWVLKMDTYDNGYEYFLYSHVNEAGTGIIVSVLVDIHTCYTLI